MLQDMSKTHTLVDYGIILKKIRLRCSKVIDGWFVPRVPEADLSSATVVNISKQRVCEKIDG